MVDVLSRKQTILAVLPAMEDRNSLKSILKGSNWTIRFARPSRRRRPAPSGLLRHLSKVGAVLTDAHLPDGHTWRDVLREIEATPVAMGAHQGQADRNDKAAELLSTPPLIVVDRLADDALWAEVLNLGGYDVLVKPFDEKEVLHVLTMACGFRRKRAASFDPRPVQQNVRWTVA